MLLMDFVVTNLAFSADQRVAPAMLVILAMSVGGVVVLLATNDV